MFLIPEEQIFPIDLVAKLLSAVITYENFIVDILTEKRQEFLKKA
jgi:hypothetical protein